MFKISADSDLKILSKELDGELFFGQDIMLDLYATDASVYQERPVAVAIPRDVSDVKKIIQYANNHNVTLIPRTAGTSLAGQVVGDGIVVDVSKHFDQILELNVTEKWVRVQPGVIRNDLNAYLKPHGLMFGPETSTASRAMIGGMIGNNSSGLHSIVWGDTRSNILEVNVLLSDGTDLLINKNTLNSGYGSSALLSKLNGLINDDENIEAIKIGFPKAEITRRNTGYALDKLIETNDLCQLIAGSEGTLCFITDAKLKLLDLPPAEVGLVNVHFNSMRASLEANLVALKHKCFASELVDDFTLRLTIGNRLYANNRVFVEGDPRTILMVEFYGETRTELDNKIDAFVKELKSLDLGYAYPILYNADTINAWELRKGALGLLSNRKGDEQPTNLIEDCAVLPEDLPDYIDEIEALLKSNDLPYAISAHAGAGELHVIPLMNLRDEKGRELFRSILEQTAVIVKKYNGSLSGEHGDGRLRGEFIPYMMGEKCYSLFKEVKAIFDPKGIFNKGKITDSPPMNTSLRVELSPNNVNIKTTLDFSYDDGILKLAEKCSGSGDCRKTEITGGTMCPSYMATRMEKDSTRARANVLRQYYSDPNARLEAGSKDVLDLCLSCKGCKAECPSEVDVGKMKAEFMQQYYDKNGVPLRSKLIGNFSSMMKMASLAPWVYNFIYGNKKLSAFFNKMVGFHPERTMPHLAIQTFKSWFKARKSIINYNKKVAVFADEFTNYNDVHVGQNLVLLLEKLGYEVIIPDLLDSGRTYLSKGMVKKAQELAIENVKRLSNNELDIIGIEPSAILTFRDEYLDLVPDNMKDMANKVATKSLLFEEWFTKEIAAGNIKKDQFTQEKKSIKLHGHCHQKALAGLVSSKKALSFPQNYEVQLIPSGCCGMAGSFGYEEEHYELSMQVGNLVLFPSIKKMNAEEIIAAPGTSCRHQIKDGVNAVALHPIEILYNALV